MFRKKITLGAGVMKCFGKNQNTCRKEKVSLKCSVYCIIYLLVTSLLINLSLGLLNTFHFSEPQCVSAITVFFLNRYLNNL